MPTYDYDCPQCGGFEALRTLAGRNETAECPDCGSRAPRVWVSAPRLGCLSTASRRANDLNERARHEPQHSASYQRLRHPAGCGCCQPGQRSATVTGANGAKSFPSKRPWMISH